MNARVLDVPFLRPPPDLPPDEARLFVVRRLAPLLGGFLHVVQIVVFLAIDLPRLALVSVGSVALFVLAFLLTRAMRALERRLKAGVGRAPAKAGGARARVPETAGAGGGA